MATFLLVHGAWHGGWCYRDTAAALCSAGHTVFTPTLSGVGERARGRPHGEPIESPGVHRRLLARARRFAALLRKALPADVAAVFTDAFHGSALADHSGLMQPIPAEMFGIAAVNRAWVDRRCTPQALATFELPLLLTGAHASVSRKMYLLADAWAPSPFRHFAAKCEAAGGWTTLKLPSSHDVMVDMPHELAQALLTLA